jgi:hypothetical protein
MPKRRPRGRPVLWNKDRCEPDARHLWWMLRLAQGRPAIKYHQLAKEVLYREPPLPGDEFSHQRRLAKKLKDLLSRIDYVYLDDRRSDTLEDKRRAALLYLQSLMETCGPAELAEWEPLKGGFGIAWVPTDLVDLASIKRARAVHLK